MHYYAVVYLFMALIAAAVGFGSMPTDAGEIARILSLLFLVMAVVSYAVHLAGRR